MIHYLQNENFTVGVQEYGAELCSFRHIPLNLEYIWQADPAVWSRHAPVLFPIVGRLTNDTYEYEGKRYQLPQHGFARDQEFRLVSKTQNTLTFQLNHNSDTIAHYPFLFKLLIQYRLEENAVTVRYEVQNTGPKDLYFSMGGHPGFTCPLFPNEAFTDYYLQFEKPERLERYLIDQGLQTGQTEPVPLENDTILPLNYELFGEKDAIVLKNIASEKLSLRTRNHTHGLHFTFRGYPYLGIWTKGQGASFICLEPWHGIAGSIDGPTDITQKEGIILLAPEKVFTCEYKMEAL